MPSTHSLHFWDESRYERETRKVNGSFNHPAAFWALGMVWDKPTICTVCEAMMEGRDSTRIRDRFADQMMAL